MQTSLSLTNDVFLEGAYPVVEPTSNKACIKNKIKRFVTITALAALMAGITPASARDNLIFESNFEAGKVQGWARQDGKLPGATTVQSNIVRAGKYAVKLHMKRCSFLGAQCGPEPVRLNRPRAQLGNGGNLRFAMDKSYWMGFSVFIPNSWVFAKPSSAHNYHESLLNLHKVESGIGPGGCVVSPQPLGWRVQGNRWEFRYTQNAGSHAVIKDLAPIEKGKWTDWVINFKFSYGNDGFFQIWKDGKRVYNFKGNTVCKGKETSGAQNTLPYLNATVYKANWKHDTDIKERTVYYDEIRVGSSSATYNDVAPAGGKTTVQAPKNLPPKVNAGADKSAQLNSPATIALNGSASDDALPNGQLKIIWSKVSGPGTAKFSTPSKLSTSVTFSKEGKYVLRLSANDGKTSASDTINVEVQPAPAPKKNTASAPKQNPVQTVKKEPKQPVAVKKQARPNRVKNGIVVYYDFEEGRGSTIKDVSGVGRPLNLKIRNTRATSWVPGGLMIDKSTILVSSGKASKLINAVRASGAITVEAWIAPDNKKQKGPARVVTISTNGSNRNFTLGQDRSKYQVRLRTTKTGNNGTRPFLATRSNNVFPQLSHVVYTRNKKGVAKLYVNGRQKGSKTIAGKLSNWSRNYRLALANELSGGRAWLGEYQMMAFYKRALSSGEVKQNFKAGPIDE